jgi:protein-S-isoprenylcysteine O-methyltransferase Ste14
MTYQLLRALLWAGPALFSFLVLVPAAALFVDRRFGAAWPLPGWLSWLAAVLLPAGAALGGWCVWLFAVVGDGTPNPLAPPAKLVVQGPYRYSRNPMMLGGWLAGIGLALALRSPALLAAMFVIIGAGASYVRWVEEPRLLSRFGAAYRDYMNHVPAWFCIHSR